MDTETMFGSKNGGTPITAEEKCGWSTPEEFADWLIQYHGLNPASRNTVALNIKTQSHADRAIGYLEGRGAKNEFRALLARFGIEDINTVTPE